MYPHLAPEVSWTLVGTARIEGMQAVVASCGRMTEQLRNANTTFTSFRSIVGAAAVVVEAVAEYGPPDDRSVVASCDIFDFRADQVFLITSYAVDFDTRDR